METNRLDANSRFFAQRRLTRRQALNQAGVGMAAVSAQDATPPADPGVLTIARAPDMLFVQSFQSGSIVAKEGADGRYTVTLKQGLGQTIYFSDRPDRIVGASPTAQFLEGMPFLPDNPPNAALVVETAPGETDIAVVELFAPLYDPVSQGVIYQVEVLANWQDSLEMGFAEAPIDLAALAPSFGAAQFFIDDCPNEPVACWLDSPTGATLFKGQFDDQPMCWNYSVCIACEPYGQAQPDRCATKQHWDAKCDQTFPECDGQCYSENAWPFSNIC